MVANRKATFVRKVTGDAKISSNGVFYFLKSRGGEERGFVGHKKNSYLLIFFEVWFGAKLGLKQTNCVLIELVF